RPPVGGCDIGGVGFKDEYLVVGRRYGNSKFGLIDGVGGGGPLPATPAIDCPRGGELRAKLADKLVPIPLKHTDVKALVSIYLASVTVKQQYHNPYDGKIEAVYLFPLPDDAAVRDFIMVIGDRKIRGIIREKEEAKQIYQEARRQGHVASYMEQNRPNIFTQMVANIEPGKQIDIDITYFHSLKYAKGEYEFHFPMVVGPRYNPADSTGGVGAVPRDATGTSGQSTEVSYLAPEEITSNDITLEVDVDAGLPIEKLESPSHIIQVDRPEPSKAKVKLAPNDRIPNKDFVLRYKVGGKGIASALAAHRDAKGGYFTLVLQPPDSLEDIPATAREMFFVLDVSGSMNGAPIEISKRTMERCLRRLDPGDTFQIVTFASTADVMSPKPLAATPENIKRAMAYVQSQSGSGGTEMLTGIRAALDAPRDPERYRIVSFMTDGYIGNETQIFGAVRQSIRDARIFSFGIGSSVNRYLIEGLGRIGRGTTAFVGLDESSEKAVDGLYQRIEHPALTDIKFEWSGGGIGEVHPSTIPDLFVGRPVVITGRFQGTGVAQLKVTGKIAGKEHVSTMKLNLDEPGSRHAALPAVWARSRIASLSDRMIFTPDGADLTGEIRATAIEYGILSQYTAFIAVDSSRVTEGASGTTVPVPVPVPAGVKYETTVPEKK
ncbi:MAG TPA: VIT and VWA domain-containing protein, partial [Planctomycetota bacterium]|nr:VIT and VWA domain-containing protein [Planctomycetota bacterium]